MLRRLACAVVVVTVAAAAAADVATLIVECDSPCSVLVDDVFVFRAEPGTTREVEVEEGVHDVTGISAQVLGVQWQDSVQVADDERLDVVIMLAIDAELELDAEGPREREFMGDRPSRLERRDGGTIFDPETELEWTPTDNHFDLDWPTAEKYCQTLRLGAEEEDDDAIAWRLPTIDELEELVDERSSGKYRALGQLRLSGCCAWSSEAYGTISAWYMDFENGRRGFVARDYKEGGRVLCVR